MRKRHYALFFFLVAILCAGLTWLLFFRQPAKDKLSIIFNDQEKFKVGEVVDPVSLIKSSSSVNILYPKIDTSVPGTKYLTYIAIGENGTQKEFMKVIKVVSASEPILELKQEKVTLIVESKFDPKSYIVKAFDEFDGDLDVDISGKYDMKKPGNYTITYTVKNSDGKKLIKKLVLTVKEKEKKKETQKENQMNDQGNQEKTSNEDNKIKDDKESNQNIPNRDNQSSDKPVEDKPIDKGTGQRTWIIDDGQTFDEVRQECMNEGMNSGASQYTCDVLYDGDIAIGYQLNF